MPVPAVQAAVIVRSDEAQDFTPARGVGVKNFFGDLVGWLDPEGGATPLIRTTPHGWSTRINILSPPCGEAFEGRTRIVHR